MPRFSGVRRRSPARKESRKKLGVARTKRHINQARGMYFEAGLNKGKRGDGLRYYVDIRCPPFRQP